jgi:hypothetical protein
MAKSGKVQDAAAAALTAIEEALDLNAPAEPAEPAAPAATASPKAEASENPSLSLPLPSREPPPAREAAPQPAPKTPPVAPAAPPANDDRRTVGELRQALLFKPNPAIMGFAYASIVAWALLWVAFVYFHKADIIDETGSILAPKPVLALLTLVAPIVFFFVTGVMARRAHEMRLIANSMTEVAIRLIEPETVATEQIVSLSQAIRREAASMGDGIERALARAGELEVIVRGEVSNLERSYTENERRIRLLIDELAREREAVLVNADNARTALFGARDQLSHELTVTSAILA